MVDGHIQSPRIGTSEDRAADSSLDPLLVFATRDRATPAIEICVNFGIFAGRHVTSAEIDRLSQWVLDEVEAVTIISEERHAISKAAEASVHQVRIEIAETVFLRTDTDSRDRLEKRLLERVDHWARMCIAERHAES
jgi:hypothetical protein